MRAEIPLACQPDRKKAYSQQTQNQIGGIVGQGSAVAACKPVANGQLRVVGEHIGKEKLHHLLGVGLGVGGGAGQLGDFEDRILWA